jgi:hypothetical protein
VTTAATPAPSLEALAQQRAHLLHRGALLGRQERVDALHRALHDRTVRLAPLGRALLRAKRLVLGARLLEGLAHQRLLVGVEAQPRGEALDAVLDARGRVAVTAAMAAMTAAAATGAKRAHRPSGGRARRAEEMKDFIVSIG